VKISAGGTALLLLLLATACWRRRLQDIGLMLEVMQQFDLMFEVRVPGAAATRAQQSFFVPGMLPAGDKVPHDAWDERFEHPARTWASASHRAFTRSRSRRGDGKC
jgi:hypothetical protein